MRLVVVVLSALLAARATAQSVEVGDEVVVFDGRAHGATVVGPHPAVTRGYPRDRMPLVAVPHGARLQVLAADRESAHMLCALADALPCEAPAFARTARGDEVGAAPSADGRLGIGGLWGNGANFVSMLQVGEARDVCLVLREGGEEPLALVAYVGREKGLALLADDGRTNRGRVLGGEEPGWLLPRAEGGAHLLRIADGALSMRGFDDALEWAGPPRRLQRLPGLTPTAPAGVRLGDGVLVVAYELSPRIEALRVTDAAVTAPTKVGEGRAPRAALVAGAAVLAWETDDGIALAATLDGRAFGPTLTRSGRRPSIAGDLAEGGGWLSWLDEQGRVLAAPLLIR